MNGLKLDIANIYNFISHETIMGYEDLVQEHLSQLYNRTGAGCEFTGWLELPASISEKQIHELEEVASSLRKEVDLIVVVGIGGSYLGARAIISALSQNFKMYKEGNQGPDVLFAGQNIGEDYLSELIEILDRKRYAIIAISKSGTTTEPAIAFRILKQHLEKQVGAAKASQRIIAITDKSRGALRQLSERSGYRTFERVA